MTRIIFLSLVAFSLARIGAAEIYPPHQFRLTDPTGQVSVKSAAGKMTKVQSRALLAAGDIVGVGNGSAIVRIAGIGNLYLGKSTQVKVKKIESETGRPLFQLLTGQVLAKTESIGAPKPIHIEFGPGFRTEVKDGMVEVRYKKNSKGNTAALAPLRGSAKVTAKGEAFKLPAQLLLIRDDGRRLKKALDKGKLKSRWSPLGGNVLKAEIKPVPDEVAPTIVLKTPVDGAVSEGSQLKFQGTVDDPGQKNVKIYVNEKHREFADLVGPNFSGEIQLNDESQVVRFEVADSAGNSSSISVTVKCQNPAPIAKDPVSKAPKGPKSWAERFKSVATDPGKDNEAAGILAGGTFVMLLVLGFGARFFMGNLKKGAESAAGLATGVIFNRCESCDDRQFEYHLFYTAEKVTSPFMRNLINNVNPMATAIMNESLENLLNTGLQGSAGAKGAEQRIRVTCTWCDQCKVGNLKLEHMKGSEVGKTDDYQIIHPIFIEWVRKVYD